MDREDYGVGILRVQRGIRGTESVVPTSGASGYMPGEVFRLRNPLLGQSPEWINVGTVTSCLFAPIGPVMGYGVFAAGGPVTSAGGDAAESIALEGIALDTDIAFIGHEVSDDNDQIESAISNEGNIAIVGSADPSTAHGYVYALLRNKCVPGFDVFAAGSHTSVGGNVAEDVTIAGVLATDICIVCHGGTDDNDLISDAVCAAGKITVTSSADPLVAHIWHYVVLRPRGTFKPSHYVAYAGVHTTVGGAAAEAITITGALATDIPIVIYAATDDNDTLEKSVVTANTLTVTCDADPLVGHKLAYMLLRAYG